MRINVQLLQRFSSQITTNTTSLSFNTHRDCTSYLILQQNDFYFLVTRAPSYHAVSQHKVAFQFLHHKLIKLNLVHICCISTNSSAIKIPSPVAPGLFVDKILSSISIIFNNISGRLQAS